MILIWNRDNIFILKISLPKITFFLHNFNNYHSPKNKMKRVKNWNCPPSHFSLKRIGGWAQFFFLSGGGGSHQQSADWSDWGLNERYFTSPWGHSSPNLPTTLYTVLYMTKFSSISLYTVYDEAFRHRELWNSAVTFLTTPPNNSTLLRLAVVYEHF